MAAEIAVAGVAGAAVSFLLWLLRALQKEIRRFGRSGEHRVEPPSVVILPKPPSQSEPAATAARIQRGA